MSASDIGRRPITVVELMQPRCTHVFGQGACTATGAPCYNTPGTCKDLANRNDDGSIRWRYTDDRPGLRDYSDFSDPDNPALNAIPCGVNVSTSESQINTGSRLEGRSPLGVTGSVTVGLPDFMWNDTWGDPYLDQRAGYAEGRILPDRAPHWALWTARNDLYNDMYLTIYDGYESESLDEMRARLYALDNVTGPSSEGAVSLKGVDPLRKIDEAEFPPTSDLDLYGDIDDTTQEVRIFGTGSQLETVLGNTAPTHYLSIGTEIIAYTSITDEGDGRYLLNGVERGALDTERAEHSDEDKVQRTGRYVKMPGWLILNDLFVNHAGMRSDFIPLDEWNEEGSTYLPVDTMTRTIVSPTEISTLAGQIAQQGLFYIWWQEYAQKIKMLALRPPSEAPTLLTDEKHLLRGTTLTREPSSRITQVAVYFDQVDPFGSLSSAENYDGRTYALNGDNRGGVSIVSVYAPWIKDRVQASQIAGRLLLQYQAVPRFLRVTVDAKDREVTVGAVTDIETSAIVNPDGSLDRTRWQVISAKEVVAGETYYLNLQTFEWIGQFAVMMADDAPDYADATEEERAAGWWFTDEDGLIDGEEGSLFQ